MGDKTITGSFSIKYFGKEKWLFLNDEKPVMPVTGPQEAYFSLTFDHLDFQKFQRETAQPGIAIGVSAESSDDGSFNPLTGGSWINEKYSSNVKAYRWIRHLDETSNGSLLIKFRSGATYEYLDVHVDTAEEFHDASSKGQYFNRYIKDQFSVVKLTAGESLAMGGPV